MQRHLKARHLCGLAIRAAQDRISGKIFPAPWAYLVEGQTGRPAALS